MLRPSEISHKPGRNSTFLYIARWRRYLHQNCQASHFFLRLILQKCWYSWSKNEPIALHLNFGMHIRLGPYFASIHSSNTLHDGTIPVLFDHFPAISLVIGIAERFNGHWSSKGFRTRGLAINVRPLTNKLRDVLPPFFSLWKGWSNLSASSFIPRTGVRCRALKSFAGNFLLQIRRTN